jgi:hypothetical protein
MYDDATAAAGGTLETRITTMAKRKKQYVTDESGKRVAVVLPLREYEELLEDLHDLTVLHERRDEPPVPADEFERQLRSDGVV